MIKLTYETACFETYPTTIVIACFNCAHALKLSLPKLSNNTAGQYELLVMLDTTVDDSLSIIKSIPFDCIRVYTSQKPLFEARAESFLMSKSHASKYIISVQPDQLIHERAWNEKMSLPLTLYSDVFSVSARCCHSLHGGNYIGRCDRDVFSPLDRRVLKNKRLFHIRDTCNRGPLLFHAKRLRKLNFYDWKNFYMDNSDHDLHCRAHAFNWKTGLYQIDFHAPSELRTVGHKIINETVSLANRKVRLDLAKNATKSTCFHKTQRFNIRETREITGFVK